MNEAKLRAFIFIVLSNHFFSHRGRCECGEIVTLNPTEIMQHIEDKLVEKILANQEVINGGSQNLG